ncbi:MAG TPA: 30S ribosome-binding factor RbfA [Rhodothermales bacterium]|nr:30S ribosome-binding factor RbfA [Rhodothermales bacterium]
MSIRTERVAKLLQREVADILQTEFSQQLPSMITVTDARVTKDLSIVYVYVSIFGENVGQRQAAFKHLEDLTPQIRSALAGRVRHQLRAVPEIRFFLDETLEKSRKLDDLFDRIRAERERREE